MFFRPDFIQTNEEWVIWLLGSESHMHATFEGLIQRTRLLGDQIDEAVRNLERIKTVRVDRNAELGGKIISVTMLPVGKAFYNELESRSRSRI